MARPMVSLSLARNGRMPIYPESQIRALRNALNNAKTLEAMTAEQRNSYKATDNVAAKAKAIEDALDALDEADIDADLSVYTELVETAENLDNDVYDYVSGQMEKMLKTISFTICGDDVVYKVSENETLTIKTIDDEDGLNQDMVDSAASLLLSSLTDHIRMYSVSVCEGNAEIGFTGNGRTKETNSKDVFSATYNSTAVFTSDNEDTAWYMEYEATNGTRRSKQYQSYGTVFQTPVFGNLKVYAVSRTESNHKVTILRDYGVANNNRPVQLIDFVENSFELPAAAAIPNYEFQGYYNESGEELSGEITVEEDTVIYAKYNFDETKNCAVKITGSTNNILYNKTVAYNTKIDIEDENAYAWVELVKDGTNVNYRAFSIGSELSFYATESTDILAVTKAQFDDFNFALPAVNIKQSDALTIVSNGANKTLFNGMLIENPNGNETILEYGILVGAPSSKDGATPITPAAEQLVLENSGQQIGCVVLRAKSTMLLGTNQFTIAVSRLSGNIVYRGYIIYQTSSGMIKTRYTDVYYQTI